MRWGPGTRPGPYPLRVAPVAPRTRDRQFVHRDVPAETSCPGQVPDGSGAALCCRPVGRSRVEPAPGLASRHGHASPRLAISPTTSSRTGCACWLGHSRRPRRSSLLVAELDDRGLWGRTRARARRRSGCPGGWACGLGAARERVRVRHALRQLPAIATAFGEVCADLPHRPRRVDARPRPQGPPRHQEATPRLQARHDGHCGYPGCTNGAV